MSNNIIKLDKKRKKNELTEAKVFQIAYKAALCLRIDCDIASIKKFLNDAANKDKIEDIQLAEKQLKEFLFEREKLFDEKKG